MFLSRLEFRAIQQRRSAADLQALLAVLAADGEISVEPGDEDDARDQVNPAAVEEARLFLSPPVEEELVEGESDADVDEFQGEIPEVFEDDEEDE